MKKNTESKKFRSTRLFQKSRVSRTGQNLYRTPNLESLEERQMLSAVSLAGAEMNIQSEVFYVTLNNAQNMQDTSVQHVTLHVQGDVNVGDILVQDSQGAAQKILNSKVENGVTSLLLQMGLGTDYTVTVSGVDTQNPINVLFTLPGDTSGNGSIESTEYFTALGSVMKGQGMTAHSAMLFQMQYGIDLSKVQLDPLLDLDGNGRLTQNELELLVRKPEQNISLRQEITVKPKLSDLTVENGSLTPAETEDGQLFVTQPTENGALVLKGQIPADGKMQIQGEISFQTADGKTHTVSIPDMLENYEDENCIYTVDQLSRAGKFRTFTLTLKDPASNSAARLTLSYEGAPNSENTYEIRIDSQAPTLLPDSITLDSEAQTEEGGLYTQDQTPNFTLTQALTQAQYEAVLAEIQDPANGIRLILACGSEDVQTILLTQTLFEQNVKRSGDGWIFTLKMAQPNALPDGLHTFTVRACDLAGNETDVREIRLTIDTVSPVISAEAPKAQVSEKTQILKVSVSDINAKESGRLFCGEKELSGTFNAETMTWEYSLDLAYGENIFTFQCTDKAGNTAEKEFRTTFNQAPQVTETGQKLHGTDKYLSIQTAEKNAAGEYIWDLGKVSDIFTETDGSAIENSSVKVHFDGDAVKRAVILDDGTIQLVLADRSMEDLEAHISGISLTYADEYGESAFFTDAQGIQQDTVRFTLHFTNDSEAPAVSLENSGEFAGKLHPSVLAFSGNSMTLHLKASDINQIVMAQVSIRYTANGTSQTETIDLTQEPGFEKTVTLSGLTNGTSVQISYVSEDDFGNKTSENTELAVIQIDQVLNGTISDFVPQNASPSKLQPQFDVKVDWTENEEMRAEISYSGTTADGRSVSGTFRPEFLISDGTDASTGSFTGLGGIQLADGTYSFTLTVTDNAGNQTSQTVSDFVLDQTAPTASILNSAEKTESQKLTLQFAFSDALSGVKFLTLTQNGHSMTLDPTEAFEVTLAYGENTFSLTATDFAGNTTPVSSDYVILWNIKPTANQENPFFNAEESTPADGASAEKAVFDQLMSIGLRETDGPHAGKIVLDLADHVIDERTLTLV
ncbi:MAG: Ig-like domain repeat protein, partial [Thermoguttaceae bacterium]|nr:Ig-like domain repeat protein [Thermoguttaceae bacterium]